MKVELVSTAMAVSELNTVVVETVSATEVGTALVPDTAEVRMAEIAEEAGAEETGAEETGAEDAAAEDAAAEEAAAEEATEEDGAGATDWEATAG